jgi:hypothetical protein
MMNTLGFRLCQMVCYVLLGGQQQSVELAGALLLLLLLVP